MNRSGRKSASSALAPRRQWAGTLWVTGTGPTSCTLNTFLLIAILRDAYAEVVPSLLLPLTGVAVADFPLIQSGTFEVAPHQRIPNARVGAFPFSGAHRDREH